MISCLIATSLQSSWAEQTLATLTIEEKVGQLFVVPACPLREKIHRDDLRYLVEHYHIGGILLKQGTPQTQIDLINSLTSPIPLLRFADAEWGVSMRLSETLRFPKNLTLGAIQDLSLLSRFGKHLGWECAQVGIDINFAPVVDVNTNPLNPIIGMRSFGESTSEVAKRGCMVMTAMQEAGTGACGKHFPGHGETSVDSHLDLPTITNLELTPFKALVDQGISCIMSSHLLYENEVATFSPSLIEGILRKEWGYEGLISTDALGMGALTNYFTSTEIAKKALLAGHDILLYGSHRPSIVDTILREDIPQAIEALVQGVKEGMISEETLDQHVRRILKAKEARGLRQHFPQPQNLMTENAKILKRELYRHAMTMVTNELFPLKAGPVNLIHFGVKDTFFSNACAKYTTFTSAEAPILIALYEITPEALSYIASLQQKNAPYALILFTSPYKLLELGNHPTVLVAYEDDVDAAEAAADVIFGKLEPKGILPISLP